MPVFHPSGKAVVVVNELGNTVSAYSFDPDTGALAHAGSPQLTVPQEWLDSKPPCPHVYNAQCVSETKMV